MLRIPGVELAGALRAVSWCRALHTTACRCSPKPISADAVRNIGIVAHIDAGKTTLTERLLHLTNSLSLPGLQPAPAQTVHAAPGDVDSGSTVTDFLEEERERGITIQSAAVGPVWWTSERVKAFFQDRKTPAAAITLVDTPGHVDFGIEVERTVRVVDGAVVVLDGVEGVEPQSANVWRQTKRYGVNAHTFFINKLDRAGASVSRSMRSIIEKGLHNRPALLQLPVHASMLGEPTGDNDPIVGVVDLLTMEVLRFEGIGGERIAHNPLDASVHTDLYATAREAREALVELVSSLDETLLEELLTLEDTENALSVLSSDDVRAAIRRLTLRGDIAPVLCGAAARNIGVQPLLDAVALYLPSPMDRPPVVGTIYSDTPHASMIDISPQHPDTTALAFKVVWDRRRGPVTFVRVYSGTLHAGATLLNTTAHHKERITRLMLPYADQYVDVPALQAGQIGVVLGLRDTRTGDTLVDARKGNAKKALPNDALRTLRLRRVHVPPPVFSVSVEPRSKADEGSVNEALRMLVRTDPSLHVNEGPSGGASQTVLSGMGELHLEIAKHRLENEFNVAAHLGHVRVGYRETLVTDEQRVTEFLDQEVGGRRAKVGATLVVRALHEDEKGNARLGGNDVLIDLGSNSDMAYDGGLHLSRVLEQGVASALARGPLSGFPLQGLHVKITDVQTLGPEVSTPGAVRMLMVQALRHALGYATRAAPGEMPSGNTALMEPMMHVTISAPDTYAGKLSSDISVEQHGSIVEMVHDLDESHSVDASHEVYIPRDEEDDTGVQRTDTSNNMTVIAHVPLARMMRYSTRLRALTGGAGTYRMELAGFEVVSLDRQRELLQELGRLPR